MGEATIPLDSFKTWLGNGERGLSSDAIVIRLTGEKWLAGRYNSGKDHPHDPGDFRRCMKLLSAVPVARAAIGEMRDVSREWAALVQHWDELEALALDEVPDVLGTAKANGGRAPRLYARMRELLDEARAAAPKTEADRG